MGAACTSVSPDAIPQADEDALLKGTPLLPFRARAQLTTEAIWVAATTDRSTSTWAAVAAYQGGDAQHGDEEPWMPGNSGIESRHSHRSAVNAAGIIDKADCRSNPQGRPRLHETKFADDMHVDALAVTLQGRIK